MYVKYGYYENHYLMGREPSVPEEDFEFFEKAAAREVNRYTYGRLKTSPDLVTDDVRDCVCAITEVLYQADKISKSAAEHGIAGVLTSYSNDGQSGTYDVSQSVYTETGKQKEIKKLIYLHLSDTGLLYAGVR
ncbi:MAG: hypothetical protein MSR29_11280 [Lachnospiraceae bacterium]|nr:hypothetical protein [Lachnospiraceae bacterium]